MGDSGPQAWVKPAGEVLWTAGGFLHTAACRLEASRVAFQEAMPTAQPVLLPSSKRAQQARPERNSFRGSCSQVPPGHSLPPQLSQDRTGRTLGESHPPEATAAGHLGARWCFAVWPFGAKVQCLGLAHTDQQEKNKLAKTLLYLRKQDPAQPTGIRVLAEPTSCIL